MFTMPSFTLLLSILATSRAWLLETNIREITPGTSRNVVLVCKQDNSNGTRLALNTITRIRITKLDPFCSKTTFAEIRAQTNVAPSKYNDYTVQGSLEKIENAFLKVTWPLTTKDTAGAYGCEIDGFDSLSNFASLKVNPKEIKEKFLTIDEVKKLIHLATSSYQKKQQELELEIVTLKNLLTNNLQSINRQINDQSKTLNSEITKLRESAKSEFVTKDDVKEEFSRLKNFTRDELIFDNQKEQEQHTALVNAVQNVNKSIQEKYVKITSEFIATNITLGMKIDRLDHKNENSIQQINSTMEILRGQINPIVDKLENRIEDLAKEFNKKIAEHACPCPTSTPTKPTDVTVYKTSKATTPITPKVDSLKWPDGSFGLVKPPSGCSALKHKTEVKPQFAHNYDYISVKVKSPSRATDLIYCQQGGTSSSLSSSWPSGTYCLAKTKAKCPQGFDFGVILLSVTKNVFDIAKDQTFNLQHCCRSDSNATASIRLPTEKPFYLYRYKGACQRVEGMRVRQGSITLERKSFSTRGKADTKGSHPDIKTKDKKYIITIHLCYYFL